MTETFVWSYAGGSHRVPYEDVGRGARRILLLPALSSVSTRHEMAAVAERLVAAGWRCLVPDWPGFGDQPRLGVPLDPQSMQTFLADFLDGPLAGARAVGIAAGHGATHLLAVAGRHPGRFDALALVAPTWRGPLPTAMGETRRGLYRAIRAAIETPGLGALLYRLNVSSSVVQKMLREHVYADPAFITGTRLETKLSVTRQPRARLATAAFVTGGLDPVQGREAFLALFAAPRLPPILVLRPRGAPRKSAAEMDAVAAAGLAKVAEVPGALAAHEEAPDAVATAILAFLREQVQHP